jgi:catechol 2,3-dioxygenase-like lactoylglutathione lyase family enzyme
MAAVTPMLKAKNLDETIDFYTNTLGFSIQKHNS